MMMIQQYKDAILVGGRAMIAHGSSRNTSDADYLVNDTTSKEPFIRDVENNMDFINANGHPLFKAIWNIEQGNALVTPESLLELKAYAFVQHCLNANWQKADDMEYDMKFLVRRFGLTAPTLVQKHVGEGEYQEVLKVINSVK